MVTTNTLTEEINEIPIRKDAEYTGTFKRNVPR
jgi:hypothetical protein